MLQAIIFDFGGVLNVPVDMEAINADLRVLESEMGWESGKWFKYIWDYEFWEPAFHGKLSGDEAWRRVGQALAISDQEVERLHNRILGPWNTINPTMRDLITDLFGRFKLAIITNTYETDFANTFGERYDLADKFDVIVSSAALGETKPNPFIYTYTLEQLNVQPAEAIFIDDNTRYVEGAKAVGMKAIRFIDASSLLKQFEDLIYRW